MDVPLRGIFIVTKPSQIVSGKGVLEYVRNVDALKSKRCLSLTSVSSHTHLLRSIQGCLTATKRGQNEKIEEVCIR